jgi:hypothetical protein
MNTLNVQAGTLLLKNGGRTFWVVVKQLAQPLM